MLDEYKKFLVKEVMSDDEQKKIKETTENDEKLVDEVDSRKKTTKQKEKKANKMCKKVVKANNKTTVVEKEIKSSGAGEWLLEETNICNSENISNDTNIDDIFDKQEYKIKQKVTKKIKELSKRAKLLKKTQLKNTKQKKRLKKDELKNLKDLSFKKELERPIIDEELGIEEKSKSNVEINMEKCKKALDSQSLQTEPPTIEIKPSIIDPNKLADVKLKQHVNNFICLNESIGVADDDVDLSGDEDSDTVYLDRQMTISQAFEDDDIIADFTRDKAKESEVKDEEIDLFMPGWGSWAGAGISAERQATIKNKRLVLKLAKKEKRRDDNKGGLYINETTSKQLRSHLVSEVPFPFTSVADYEGSIRATIGRNCVPETAFRMLTRPAVITHKGQVIEPMDQSEITKPQRRLRHVVDRRIARLNENHPAKTVKTK
uniref:U3 small nucleolar RNA-associated protein 14 n=2 Tax=Bactrocera latifrons TaxID=174628 RepID=A0A0K8W794_BACLA